MKRGREIVPSHSAHAPVEKTAYGLELSPQLRETWSREGGLQHNLERAQGMAQAITSLVDANAADTLRQSFDDLPDRVQDRIKDIMRLEPSGNHLVTDGMLNRMIKSMPKADLSRLKQWWDGLTDDQAVAVLAALDRKGRGK